MPTQKINVSSAGANIRMLKAADRQQQLLFQSEDAREGLAARLEKRKPDFKGQ